MSIDDLLKVSGISYERLREILVILHTDHHITAPILNLNTNSIIHSISYPLFSKII